MRQRFGEAFVRFVTARYEPVDVVFRLAERFATVLLPGGGFARHNGRCGSRSPTCLTRLTSTLTTT
jgi:hypothetical protein